MTRWAPLAALVLVGTLTACSGSDDGTTTTTDAEAGGAFPVTVSGAFGDTVIEQEPAQVLPLSRSDADILYSLGITPIAIPSSAQTDATTGGTGIWPWQGDVYPEGTPKLDLGAATGTAVESIATLSPDLMAGTAFFGLDAATYPILSGLAPVVQFDTEANADSWEASTRKIATAVGRPEKAEEVIAEADGVLTQAAADHPELQGLSYQVLITPAADGISVLCSADDNLARVFSGLGMELAPYATEVPCSGGKGKISYENLSRLDADVIVVFPDTADQMDLLTAQPAWSALPAVERGAVVTVPKVEGVPAALAFPAAPSIVWATDQLTPLVAEAASR